MSKTFGEDDFEWPAGGMINPDPAPPEAIGALTKLANLTFLDSLIKLARDDVKERMLMAREDAADELKEAVDPSTPGLERFSTEPDEIRRQIHKRIPEGLCLSLLITAFVDVPFAPYTLPVKGEHRLIAAQALALKLGVPKLWSDYAEAAVSDLKSAASPTGTGVLGVLAGVGMVAAAVPLVFLAAPAALAGGAAVLSGLAALGPGGLTGGLLVLSSVAAVGGGTATAGAMLSGSAEQVELRALLLASMAVTKSRLRPATPTQEMRALKNMRIEAEILLKRHTEISGGRAATTKAAKRKVDSIARLIKKTESVLAKDAKRDKKG